MIEKEKKINEILRNTNLNYQFDVLNKDFMNNLSISEMKKQAIKIIMNS
jgi:hypothetical protein